MIFDLLAHLSTVFNAMMVAHAFLDRIGFGQGDCRVGWNLLGYYIVLIVLRVVSPPFSQQTIERARRSKQEWLNGDEERVECAIHFVITTQQIPSKPAVI